jgi:hypothetical protein
LSDLAAVRELAARVPEQRLRLCCHASCSLLCGAAFAYRAGITRGTS